MFVAVCFQTAMDVQSRVQFSISGGITQVKTKTVYRKIDMYRKLNEFYDMVNLDWHAANVLAAGVDYKELTNPTTVNIGGNNYQVFGFGVSAGGTRWNTLSAKQKIERQLRYWIQEAGRIFLRSEGFSFSDIQPVNFSINVSGNLITYNKIEIHSVCLTNKNLPNFSAKILYGAQNINSAYFSGTHRVLEGGIRELVYPREPEILQAWDVAVNPPTTKKNGLTLGLSGAYSQTLFPKASSQYGLYCGAEGFAEINPNAAKSNGFSIKEKEFGIRPFLGVEAKDKWMIYGLCGVKYCRKNIKSETLNCNKSKAAYEIGVGTDYVLSDKFSIGAKFIKTLKSTIKVKDLNFQTSSTKILFSLSYKVN